MNLKVIDLSQKKVWKSYLKNLPIQQQDIYFIPEHYEISERKGDGKARCFIFEREGEFALYPFFLNSINDLNLVDLDTDYFDIEGAYGYNGVVTTCQDKGFRDAFYKEFNEYCADINVITEFVRYHPILKTHEFSDPNIKPLFNRKTVFLNLKAGYEWIWNNAYSSNNRNMIRKAKKHHLKVKCGKNVQDYMDFYLLHKETMKRVKAESYYYFTEEYYKDFKNFLGEHQKIINIYYKGELICGLLLMMYKNYAHYHLSARKKEYGYLAANNLALDQAIQIAIEAKCKTFHFGGGITVSETDPLFKFKSRFSRQTAEFHIGKKIYNKVVYKKIIKAWESKFPEKTEKYNHQLLKYKM